MFLLMAFFGRVDLYHFLFCRCEPLCSLCSGLVPFLRHWPWLHVSHLIVSACAGPSSKHIKLTVNKNEQMFASRRLFFLPSCLLSAGAAASPGLPSVSSYLRPRSSIIFPLPVSFSDTHYLLLPVYMQRTHPSLPVQYAQDISAVCVPAPSWPADTSSYQPTGETQTVFRR